MHITFPRARCGVFKLVVLLTNIRNPKNIQFEMISNREKQQILAIEKLKPTSV